MDGADRGGRAWPASPAPATGWISNFTGAEAAAELLRGTDVWRTARTIKSNPASPSSRSDNGIRWSELTEEKVGSIPLLAALHRQR